MKPLLPGDDTADGSFDNFADVLSISTAHLERYMSVARQVTRLATGLPPASPTIETFEIPLHVLQDDRQSEDLPLGSRGGIAIHHDFPVDGEYLIKVRLQRQYQDYLKGMGWPQQLDVRLDGKLLKRFTVGGRAAGQAGSRQLCRRRRTRLCRRSRMGKVHADSTGDAGLEVRAPGRGGSACCRRLVRPGDVGAGRPSATAAKRARHHERPGLHGLRERGLGPDRRSLSRYVRTGERHAQPPRDFRLPAEGLPRKNGPAPRRSFRRMARLAYRRPGDEARMCGRCSSSSIPAGAMAEAFDAGIQFALERMLVDPDFLLRVHRDPARPNPAGEPHRLSDLEVASRLSFFLWSSIPDERLLALAERGQLTNPPILEKEVRRMLADPRAAKRSSDNFAAQWLNLRRVEEVVVDPDRYPNYDLSLLQAFQQETELFVASTIREDRSVVGSPERQLYVRQRTAGAALRDSRDLRQPLPARHAPEPDQRGGLLAQGALLATTSYPDRTSPVLRGKWLLNNIFGLPVPPPPPGVDTNLEDKPGAAMPRRSASGWRSTAQIPRATVVIRSIDPLGFALENFDVIGGWRTIDESGQKVDASGVTVSGKKIEGLTGLRSLLLGQPEQFPRTVTEKLMAYALGPEDRVLRSAGGEESCPRRRRAGLSMVVDCDGDCEEPQFLDAERDGE